MRSEEEYPDWSKIPIPLQHQFFSHARDEALKNKIKLLEEGSRLEEFRKYLNFKEMPKGDRWKDWRIACVDGSFSPSTSERIGARYGVYCAGYMLFEGDKFVEEGYKSGKISQDQMEDPELTQRVLSLLCTKLEREIAHDCLKDVDFLIIDGSFFGFRAKLHPIRGETINLGEFERVADLVDRIKDLSLELMNSMKSIGIIKRVLTTAFDGWLIMRQGGDEKCINRNDRAVLASLMPSNSWYAYEWLLEFPEKYLYLSRLRTLFHHRRGKIEDLESLIKQSEKLARYDIRRDLKCPPETVLKTSRYYVRCLDSTSPFCFEAHKDTDVNELLAYFRANYNPATGLPFPLDLIDGNVSLPRGFTKEFVEEVEALLIQDSDLDKIDLTNFFMYLNPQKKE